MTQEAITLVFNSQKRLDELYKEKETCKNPIRKKIIDFMIDVHSGTIQCAKNNFDKCNN